MRPTLLATLLIAVILPACTEPADDRVERCELGCAAVEPDYKTGLGAERCTAWDYRFDWRTGEGETVWAEERAGDPERCLAQCLAGAATGADWCPSSLP